MINYKNILVIAFAFALGAPLAQAAISQELDLGSTGEDVTELQTYLATNPSYYPAGIISGYFGALTQAAVQKFQIAQGIVSSGSPATTGFGRVGPATMLRLNALLSGGGTTPTSWDTVPILSDLTIDPDREEVRFDWRTNEGAQGQVYIDDAPLTSNEATGPRQLPYVSGTLYVESGGLQTNHSVSIDGLDRNTRYYYLVRSIDSAGNMSMIWPGSFVTE